MATARPTRCPLFDDTSQRGQRGPRPGKGAATGPRRRTLRRRGWPEDGDFRRILYVLQMLRKSASPNSLWQLQKLQQCRTSCHCFQLNNVLLREKRPAPRPTTGRIRVLGPLVGGHESLCCKGSPFANNVGHQDPILEAATACFQESRLLRPWNLQCAFSRV